MNRRTVHLLPPMMVPLLLAACVAPSASPQAIQRLEPAEFAARVAAIEAARPAAPLSLDEIVRKWKAGAGSSALVDEIRCTGTRHALTPQDVERLRGQGVAPEVIDEIRAAQARWAADQASADKVRKLTAEAAAEDRARAEAARRRALAPHYYPPYGSPFYDPMRPYGYGQPFGYPGPFGPRGGLGWGIGIRR